MNAHVTLQARVEQYLAERRKLGFALRSMGPRLFSFARYVAAADHHGPLSVDLMAAWARLAKAGHGDRSTWARRLNVLRPFTRWLRQFEPDTEVPDEAIFGQVPGRMTPHVYREPEIMALLAAARQIGPDGGLRPLVMETLFGLIACTGLRISEALGLLDAADGCWASRSRTAKSTASSTNFGGNSVGSIVAAMARRASTTFATPSPCAGWCSGMSRALTWVSGCWRCRLTSATSRSPAPTGTSPACRS